MTTSDLRLALRKLRQRPLFSLSVILILGIGMGATTAVLDLTNLLAWRKLPVAAPDQVVKVFTASQRGFVGPYNLTAYRDYLDYRDGNRSFSSLAAHTEYELLLETGEGVEQVTGMAVSGNFFEVLGLKPSAGRLIMASDDRAGSAPAMVLSHHLWQRLGTDREALGNRMKLEEQAFTVVGVARAGFTNVHAGTVIDVFFPVTAAPRVLSTEGEGFLDDRARTNVNMIGRLRPGVSRTEAQADLAVLARGIDADHPRPEGTTRQLTVTPNRVVHPIDLARMTPTLKLFAVAVVLLLAITCANVAHLLLARSTARRREWGIRQSIGASRWRLIRQLLTENLILALGGGLCGLLLAYWARAFLVAYAGSHFAGEMRFDGRVLAASFGVCLLATLLFGLAPALVAVRLDLVAALKGVAGGSRQRRFSAGKLLSAAQVALCVVLLVAGALLAQSVWNRLNADLGFDDDNLVIARFKLPREKRSAQHELELARELQRRAAALPMVDDAGLGFLIPPIMFDISLPFQLPADPETQRSARFNFVDAGYFPAMGIALEQGRLFQASDAGSQSVVVVNRKLAEELWPDQDPLGQTLINTSRRPGDAGPEYRVIGVVGSVSQHRSGHGGEGVVYYSLSQRFRRNFKLVLRSTADSEVVLEALRGLTAELDARLVPYSVITGEANRKRAFTFERMQAQAIGVFAVLGLLLAILGIFGVLTYAVSRRVREVGIRMAVGARSRDILWLIVGQGMWLALAGIGVGLVATVLTSRLLHGLLFGIEAGDPRVIIGVVSTVLAATLGAAYLPARRASRLDPLNALRHDG